MRFPESNSADGIANSSKQHLGKKFESTGSTHDLLKSRRTRKRTEELKEEIKEKLEAMPIVSSHRLTVQLPVSHSKMYCVMQKVRYPYKIQVLQELKPLHYGKHVHFCYSLHYVYHCHDVLDTMFSSNKARFHLIVQKNKAKTGKLWDVIVTVFFF